MSTLASVHHGLLIIPIHWLASSLCLLSTSKLVCGERSGATWLPSHHPGGCCTLVVVEGIPPFYVKRFEYPEKRYINVPNYYYWVILKGQQIYTVIQAVHSLLYIVAKCHFFSVVTWKDIIKKMYKNVRGVLTKRAGTTVSTVTISNILHSRGLKSCSACKVPLLKSAHVQARVVTIYRYDDIPQYKHVRLSYRVHLLIYGIWWK